MKLLSALLVVAVAGISSMGCYSTVVRNADAKPAPATVEYDGKWHSGAIGGIVEISGPYDLSKVCPNGWSEVHTKQGFVNGLVSGVTFGLYNPQTVTIHCSQGGAPAPAAADAAAKTEGGEPAATPAAAPAN